MSGALTRRQRAIELVDHGVAGELSERSREAYAHDLRMWCAFLEERGVLPQDAQPRDVIAFLGALRDGSFDGTPRAQSSVNRARAAINRAYKLVCVMADDWNHNPAANVPGLRQRRPPPRALELAELRRLLSLDVLTDDERRAFDESRRLPVAAARDLAVLTLLCVAGLRRAEVVDLRYPTDLVRHEDRWALVGFVRKGGRDETALGLDARSSRVLSAWLRHRGDEPGPVFRSPRGGKLDLSTINRIVKRRAESAGVEGVEPHRLRHSFVTYALAQGVRTEEVQYAAGHTDPRTTQGYDQARVALQGAASEAVASLIWDAVPDEES